MFGLSRTIPGLFVRLPLVTTLAKVSVKSSCGTQLTPFVTTIKCGGVPTGSPLKFVKYEMTFGVQTTVKVFVELATTNPGNNAGSNAGSLVRATGSRSNKFRLVSNSVVPEFISRLPVPDVSKLMLFVVKR